MDLGIAGRSALVVGASTGIGFESARLLAREGVAVTIAARHDDSLAEAAATISDSSDATVDTLQLDATTAEAASVLAAHFGDRPLDIVVVAVGGSIRGPVESFDDDQWRENYDLNVLAPVRVVRTLLPNLLASEHGTVVILGAAASKMPYPNQGVSNVHKAGVLALVKTLAAELAPKGVRVNAVCPGRTKTRLWLNRADQMAKDQGTTPEAVIEEFSEEIPLRRFAEPHEIAGAVAFLASDRAAYITGQSLSVDGGIGKGLL